MSGESVRVMRSHCSGVRWWSENMNTGYCSHWRLTAAVDRSWSVFSVVLTLSCSAETPDLVITI